MPLYKTINFNSTTQILVWKITESLEDLLSKVVLKETTQLRLNGMKSELHQRGFLSVRMLLQEAGFNDFDLHYDAFGKPYLNPNERHTEPVEVSITHSHNFSVIIISEDAAGIDIELQREKIMRIADKFVNEKELSRLRCFDTNDYIRKLTVKWGVKESIFKIRNESGISFKNHIQVNTFELKDTKTTALLDFENTKQEFNVYFEEFENFTLVYAFEKI
ncbi:4'-phosphopantetheinyl transferase family protein [Flavobacterium cellulosilyticum]|uniref:4'-phosphopantetheinyl transferase superfamily protein n=1 Tax=Flavobacterium cellulosilyticum TaxID=2541731 RepID=A0A4R5CE40_9FLAO|nr:4'-phosphopantetheinyl transferase superfamily protein [Flavobacterium cellulosilyticum]TDD96600.1 4'-phosphopantetheinyl transferase superfamily protein [Flavobacterium cellulosilyticum]